MKNRQVVTSPVIAFSLISATSASAQNPPRVRFGGGAGSVTTSPKAVLIDSSFFPDVRVGPSQTLDTRTEFVTTAPDWSTPRLKGRPIPL
jgi:hypothetical protein